MKKRFVASYSCGKDSALAVQKAIASGMEPLSLFTTYNANENRSWFHGVPVDVLDDIADATGMQMKLIKTDSKSYNEDFEKFLLDAKAAGADACVFGDIDIEDHLKWCADRCAKAGFDAVHPLYGMSREDVVDEFLSGGFTAHFTIIDTSKISSEYLGQPVTKKALCEIKSQGADYCGEHGEYHTFVSNGPFFYRPVKFCFGEKISIGSKIILPVIKSNF
ncbi:MAG: adenine nucleotide alpha hydrolase [Defluviitaleaceae bacterium]|nr:adenine nucleotide alpha hydrolase [Defluviitaleaceae bacterium]